MKNAIDKIGEFNKFGSVLGLERIRELLRRLGNPQKDLKIIHVAGTNGKGSVCRYIYEVLRKAGYNVGIYSSPYLEEFNERIEFNGTYISNEYLDKYADEVSDIARQMCDEGLLSPTEFDVVTSIGFMYFAEMKADFVLLEVGLGGIGDSTNVIDEPIITAIASVSMDHMDRLGNTIEEIAKEKAGIIKNDITLVSGVDNAKAKKVIEDIAEERKAPFIDASARQFEIKEENIYGSVFDCTVGERKYEDIEISMAGRHQIANGIVALTVLEELSKNGIITLTSEAVYSGMKYAKNKGRFEVMKKDPIYILDGAHNEAGMERFLETVKNDLKDKKLLTVVGVLEDKDIDGIMKNLKTVDGDFVATEPNNPRKLSMEKMADILSGAGKNILATLSPEKTVAYAAKTADKYDAILFVGSFYLIGEIRRLLNES